MTRRYSAVGARVARTVRVHARVQLGRGAERGGAVAHVLLGEASEPRLVLGGAPVVVTISESEEQSAPQLVEVPQSSFCRAQMAEHVAEVFDPVSSSPLQALVPRRVNNIVIAALRSIVVVSI